MKFSGNHRSLIDLSYDLLRYLDRLFPDLKVSPGIIVSKRSARTRNHKIKLVDSISGIEVTITSNATVQKLRIFDNRKELINQTIKDFCEQGSIQFVDQNTS